jgi:hypothetical protein
LPVAGRLILREKKKGKFLLDVKKETDTCHSKEGMLAMENSPSTVDQSIREC